MLSSLLSEIKHFENLDLNHANDGFVTLRAKEKETKAIFRLGGCHR
jgi:hypothetical protein